MPACSPERSMPSSAAFIVSDARPASSLTTTRAMLPTLAGLDVLVGAGELARRARVQPALVRERARTHVGRLRVGREVRGLGDEVADLGEQSQLVAA